MIKFLLTIVSVFLCFMGFPQDLQNLQSVDSLQFTTLFSSESLVGKSCFRIPVIIKALNGDLIAVADERLGSCIDLRGSTDINIVMRRSTDNGNSWSEVKRVIDYPLGQSASDPSLIVDHVNGTIFLFFNFMDNEREKDVFHHRYIKSTDNGITWSEAVDITDQITLPEWHNDFVFMTSGGGIQTHSGKLLHTLVNLQKGLFLFGSNDLGASWYLIPVALKPADESKIIELENGSWMINSRVNGLGFRYVHISADEGQHWLSLPDSSLTDPGCNAGFISCRIPELNNGKDILLFSNINSATERKNLVLRASFDNGIHWTAGKTVYAGSAAYSSITVLKDGSIGLLFEKDDYSTIDFVKIPMEWVRR